MRTPLFSVTRDDFKWDYYRGSGNGGQHKQKTSSACRCTHVESGAVGQSQDHREQPRNRQLAFERCVKSKRFQVWLKLEIAKRCGEKSIEEQVDDVMKPINLKVESKSIEGKWIDFVEELESE